MIVKFFTEDIPNAFNTTVEFLKIVWATVTYLIFKPVQDALDLLNGILTSFSTWAIEVVVAISEGFAKIYDVGKHLVEGLWERNKSNERLAMEQT